MVKPADFEISSIQSTIFTPGLSFVSSKVLGFALETWGEKFDATPVSMPLPPDAPHEIPRIILQSSDQRYKIELAPGRANLFWLRQTETDTINTGDFLDLSTDLLCGYAASVNGKVGRIAAVLNRFFKEQNPGVFLVKHFCKDSWQVAPFDRPESFEIHARKQYVLAGRFSVNSWVRCKTGFIKMPNVEKIILVEQDINTLGEEMESKEFSIDQIKEFFNVVPSEFDSILSLYFPQEG